MNRRERARIEDAAAAGPEAAAALERLEGAYRADAEAVRRLVLELIAAREARTQDALELLAQREGVADRPQ